MTSVIRIYCGELELPVSAAARSLKGVWFRDDRYAMNVILLRDYYHEDIMRETKSTITMAARLAALCWHRELL